MPCKLVDFKRVLNVCRGSAIFCQIIVQSIPQLQDRYPKTEWEELIGCTDIQICLGCNDVDTATYISKKCGILSFSVCFFMVCNLLSLRVRASL
ncbi:MAG: TraM recognition domain-containing protein [Oscillospiraceae bacterium]|nr:TraM recognition domain-containing protein [Oscillospiraceae bacterium]